MARTARAGDAVAPDPVDALVRENVRAQLANLATHPSVARGLAARTLALHGWVYDIPSGTVERLEGAGRPVTLAA
ncbi:carbonic anhydrase [Streptomyces sp. NPDC048507]|uniref:carbonic anhydrase n=1 Tax=Streptomyces sp. NPDC048507 TaxID=3365560 RepID=UPI003717B38E